MKGQRPWPRVGVTMSLLAVVGGAAAVKSGAVVGDEVKMGFATPSTVFALALVAIAALGTWLVAYVIADWSRTGNFCEVIDAFCRLTDAFRRSPISVESKSAGLPGGGGPSTNGSRRLT